MHPEDRSIGELAYRLWQARGCPSGTAEQDWLEAERQLKGRPPRPHSSEALDDSLKGTFPASDPPASRLPDVPPANAAAKWQAAQGPRADTPRLDTSRVEISRADSAPPETSRKNPPRRRSQAKSAQAAPGTTQAASGSDPKPKPSSKPRNDPAS